jgi:NAD(P)H-flavin reductase
VEDPIEREIVKNAEMKAERDTVLARVHHVRPLTERTYVLRIDRCGIEFQPGQYFILSPVTSISIAREYSAYSGDRDPYLEFLIREVDDGSVSRMLKVLRPDDSVMLDGPYGNFVIEQPEDRERKYLFVASGTGIAPFRSLVRSHPSLDYRILHGIRLASECYDRDQYESSRFTSCVSREDGGDFRGRVTEYLQQKTVDPGHYCYFSGNSKMVYEALRILQLQGVPRERLFTEVFFWG